MRVQNSLGFQQKSADIHMHMHNYTHVHTAMKTSVALAQRL